jgi:hypothetical protein
VDLQPPRATAWRDSVPRLEPKAAAAVFYVDATKGSDSGAGTMGAPLKTIQAAVDKAATAGGGAVLLRAGTFYLKESVKISSSDISVSTYQSEHVVVSGGVHLSGLAWKKVPPVAANADPEVAVDTYSVPVPKGLSFLELFNASTARLIPARNPDGNSELAPQESNYKFSGKETACKDFGPCDTVVVNDTCPGCVDNSKGYFNRYSMGVGGPANNFVPAISYWAQPKPHGGGANTYDIPEGVATTSDTGLKTGSDGGGFVFMMQTHHWGSWVYEIADVAAGDGAGQNITFGAGGFQEARGGSGGCGTGSFYVR